MELQPVNDLIKSANHHITEREARRLYFHHFDDRWTRRPWFSFNDQLDQFYEQCLKNKFGPWNINYFLVKRSTLKESNIFEKEFRHQEDVRYMKRQNKAKKQFQMKMHKIDKIASEQNWSETTRKKHRQDNKLLRRFKYSQLQIKKNQHQAAKYPEFLDHQLFHGSRITNDWNFIKDDRQKIGREINQLMQNNWPYKTPYEMHLELLEIYKETKSETRHDMITDINKQLQSRKKS